ncbi:hypothetical protein B0H19DRAFT_862640, partial [Mycena capillaripes]
AFLWDGKKARVSHETMILDIGDGGKQILDITARNEAIDLWNLRSYLVHFAKFLETSYLNIRPGQILNIFLQDIHVPISSRTALPDELKQMILTARKYRLQFTGLSISDNVKLSLPTWKHPGINKLRYQKATLRDAATCLRLSHQVRSV